MDSVNKPHHIADFNIPPHPFPFFLATSVALLILSEANSFYLGSAGFKILASLSFLGAGINAASSRLNLLSWHALVQPENRFPVCMVLGLAFSLIGDVFLIPSRQNYHQNPSVPKQREGDTPSFKAGTFFFALAHIAYVVAFLSQATSADFRWADFAMSLTFGALLTDWLGLLKDGTTYGSWFAVPKDMKGLVTAYVSIIMVMVATATATDKGHQKIAGAWIFMISDLFVASNAFGVKEEIPPNAGGRSEWKSTSVGWVAYFAAQLLLAGCI